MQQKEITVRDLAAKMQAELCDEKFNVVNLSHYRAGRSLPRARYLTAISRAIGVPVNVLVMPEIEIEKVDNSSAATAVVAPPQFRIEDLHDGHAFLQINERLPWHKVIQVLAALKGLSSEQSEIEDDPSPCLDRLYRD